MKTFITRIFIFTSLYIAGNSAWSCTVKPAFTSYSTHTCGLPYIVKANNTSNGTYNKKAKYWWKVNNILTIDTFMGLDSIVVFLKQIGNNKIILFAKDSSGCIDSSSSTIITVTSNSKKILDQNGIYTYSPSWINCIQYVTDPDTFSIRFSSADTLKSLKIVWGDGTIDSSGGNIPPNTIKSHLFASLGVFTVKIITKNGTCIDTVYGTVTSQRQPTAGIIGPPSGSNRGCVPHKLRIINNSYNISNTTSFEIDWGVGAILKLPYTSFNDTLYNTYRTGMCGGVIKITAKNACGNSVSTWNPVDISDRDKALWTVDYTCDPTKSHIFHNASSDRYCLLPDVKEYFWDFGDGTTVGWTTSKADQNHIFKTEGDYIITLIAKNSCGYDTFKSIVPVYYQPVAGFKFNSNRGCLPLIVSLTDTSKGRGYTRIWTVKENGTTKSFTDSVFNYTFTLPGVHTISLMVANKCGNSTVTKNFIINSKPTAQFANISSNCIPVNVVFGNTSTSYFNNPVFSWDFGDSTYSSLKNPLSKMYAKPGNYVVRLIVSDSCGNDTFQQSFDAFNLPVAALNGDTVGCTFDSLSFNNQSINATNFNWNFGDGTTLNNIKSGISKHVFNLAGQYIIQLISSTISGCSDTTTHAITIKPGAKALFDINQSFACSPATFKFVNNSIYGKDFSWYANGKLVGSSINLADSILMNDSSIVHLKLKVTSNSSCQGDSIEKVYFTPKNPKAIISNIDSGCGVLKVNFINNSTYFISSFWNLGNGANSQSKNPIENYLSALNNDTMYYPELKVSNWAGCIDSVKSSVKVFPSPLAVFSTDKAKGCGPLSVSFANASRTNNKDSFNTLNHTWNFGDGTYSFTANPSHTFSASLKKDTFYNVTLISTTKNGCVDTSLKSIQVYPLPTILFSADKKEGCALLTVNFSNQSQPNDTGNINSMSFIWNSGNGKVSTSRDFNAVYGASIYNDTTYKAKLVGYSEHGCVDSSFIDIIVHPQPDAAFQLNNYSGCTPLVVSTKNLSKSNDGGILTHLWKFSNSIFSTSENDSTLYFNTTNSDVSLAIWYEAKSQFGCKDTATQTVIVRPKPIAKFNVSAKKGCAPLLLKVTDVSVNAFNFFWGQNNQLNIGAITESMILPGLRLLDTTYTIGHHVVSPYGCISDTVYQDVYVMGRPIADFEYSKDSFCARDLVSVINKTLGGYKYNWKFGDNTTSAFINPKHKYVINPGTGKDSVFKIILEATNFTGCKDTASHSITVINRPLDNFNVDKKYGCTDLFVKMVQTSTTFKTLYWDFGDNSNFETGDSVLHQFVNQFDNITIQPKITLYRQKFNCMDTVRTFVIVYPKPSANFKVVRKNLCDEGVFQFVNQSRNNVENNWVFENGTTYPNTDLSLILPASVRIDTVYTMKLSIKNVYGCKDSTQQLVKVKQQQSVSFTTGPLIACENGKVNFTNQSTGGIRYLWSLGDGGLLNEMNPSYVYLKYGNYKVVLYGYDKDGCVDSSNGLTYIKILETPKADFSFLPSMPKLPNARVDFTGNATINTINSNALVYEWNFGDKSFPTKNKTDQNPFHIYSNAGSIQVKLVVYNQQCSDFIVKPIFIEDIKPEINFTPDTVEGCIPLKVKFKNQSVNVNSYRWIFGDGSPDSYDIEPTHVFELPGIWDVTLVATGNGGTSTKTYKYLINTFPKPIVDFYTAKKSLNLPNAVFYMQNTSINIVKSNWIVFDSLGNIMNTSEIRDPSFNVPQMGVYDVRLIGTNYYGCSDTMRKSGYLTVLSNSYVFTPNAFSPNMNGKNEIFKPSLYNINPSHYEFRIFDRWGEKLFETTDLEAAWDGTFNGGPCEQETYVWTLFGEYENGDLFTFRGTVTLLR